MPLDPTTDPATDLLDEVDSGAALAAMLGLEFPSQIRGLVDDCYGAIAAKHHLTVQQLEARTCSRRTTVRRARKLAGLA